MKSYMLKGLLLFSLQGIAQVPFDQIKTGFETELQKYCSSSIPKGEENIGKAVNDSVFRQQFRNIFSTVVVGSSDVVTSGSAISYTQDKFKGTFSLNTVLSIGKSSSNLLELGASVTNKDNNYYLYSEGTWSNDISLKIGYTVASKFTQFFLRSKCDDIQQRRKSMVFDTLKEYDRLMRLDVKKLQASIDSLERTLHQNNIDLSATNNPYKTLQALKKDIVNIERIQKRSEKDVAHLVYGDLAKFDVNSNIFHGYRIWWFNFSGTVTNSSFKIENEDIINEDYQKRFKNIVKFAVEANANLQQNGQLFLQMAQIYGRVKRNSFLDEPGLKNVKFSVSEFTNPNNIEDVSYFVVDETGAIIQNYNNLQNPVMNVDIGGYYAILHFFKKRLGVNVKCNFNLPLNSSTVPNYTDNYTALVGLVGRVSKKEWSAATFTLNAGVESIPYDVRARDFFSLKFSVGVPFTIFENSKK